MANTYAGNIKIDEGFESVTIKIPADRNWFLVVVLLPFILIWIAVEFFLVPHWFLSNFQNAITSAIPILVWTFFGGLAIKLWLWHTFGETSLVLHRGILTIRKRFYPFFKTKHFKLPEMQNVHVQNRDVDRTKYVTRRNNLLSSKTNDYTFATVRAVDWLSENDANYVVDKLRMLLQSRVKEFR